jgi:hypothetical protein
MILGLVLLAGLGAAQGKEASPAPAHTLEIGSERNLGVPVFPFYDLIQSDQDGNLFFHVGESVNDPTVLKISKDGSPTIYRSPSDLPKDAYFRRFYVTRSGELYTLIADSNGAELFCIPYRSNGSPRSPFKLPLEGQVAETEFAVFENGNIILGGFFRAPEASKGKRFRYLLNGNGELLRKLETAAGNVDVSTVFSRLQPGGVAEAYDGNLYTLAGTGGGRFDVYTIAPDGAVERKLTFKAEDADFAPLQLLVDPRYLVTVSHKRRKNALNQVEILLIDLTTGEIAGRYTPPDQAGNMLVHFSSKEGFKFLNSRKGVYWLLTAPLQ